ncbi:hypothetical protein EJ02DRAFT_196942 [Clathrospora elynae]|uniref:CCHC-type domain-containing protein n=1 Tax=Clathrospora elynae TaxID=706981 RepID=A0A6A5T415_9PLEO|nr:hypothetical protein EJ02DRAFT_196942 [Clathrospora elynae]
MSSLSRRACFKCGNVGHYAGKPHPRTGYGARCCVTLAGANVASGPFDFGTCSARPRAVWKQLHSGMRLTDTQRCARLPKGSATTVRHTLHCLRARADIPLGKQPGHESNGCPHPRTTESTSSRVHGPSPL